MFHLSLLVVMINFALVSFIYDYCDYDQFNVKNVHGMLNVKGQRHKSNFLLTESLKRESKSRQKVNCLPPGNRESILLHNRWYSNKNVPRRGLQINYGMAGIKDINDFEPDPVLVEENCWLLTLLIIALVLSHYHIHNQTCLCV